MITITTDPYTSGEKPRPFTVSMGVEDDLTGFDIEATMADNDGAELTFNGIVSWADAPNAIVRVTLGEDDLMLADGVEHETRRLQVWVGDGSTRLATLVIKIPIDAAVGTPPSI